MAYTCSQVHSQFRGIRQLEAKYMSINPLRDCCLWISKTRRERGDLFKRRDTTRIEDSMRASEGRSLFSYKLSSRKVPVAYTCSQVHSQFRGIRQLEAKYMSINPLRDCCLWISKTRRERGDLFKRRDTTRIEDSMRASEGRSLFSYKLSSTFGEHQARYQMHL